jgi:prepilin-type N-terminal cleavage/methylation domain-containing protein
MKTAIRQSNRSGFTLVEVIMTMAIIVILAAGIFAMVSGSFELTSELSALQERNIARERMVELCRTNFEEVPAHARVEFMAVDRGPAYASWLSIVDHPFAFSFGGEPGNVKRVMLETDVAEGGWLRVSALYLDERENQLLERGGFDPKTAKRRIVLMEKVKQLTWRFYDPETESWIEYWNGAENPVLVELTLAVAGDAEARRTVLWIPHEKPPL